MRETAIPVAALSSTWLIPLRSIRVSSREAKIWVRRGLVLDFGMAVSRVGHSQGLREVGRGIADRSNDLLHQGPLLPLTASDTGSVLHNYDSERQQLHKVGARLAYLGAEIAPFTGSHEYNCIR